MTREQFLSILLAGLMILSSQSPAGLVEGTDPRAEPMRQALGALVQQVVAGDLEKAQAAYAGKGPHLDLLKAYVENVDAAKTMRAAVQSKFGDQPAKDVRGFDQGVERMTIRDSNTVIFSNDNPDLASSSADSPLGVGIEFQRVDGKWKVLSLASSPNTPAQHLARLAKYLSAIKAITEKVNDGHYATAADALKAANAAKALLWPIRDK